MATIRNPIEWGWDQLRLTATAVGSMGRAIGAPGEAVDPALPRVRRIAIADLRAALAAGVADFAAYRSDALFLCVLYPIIGLVLWRLAIGNALLPMLFPLASGFALIGPFAALGLYEMSRRRELGLKVGWPDAFRVLRSRSFGEIMLLGMLLAAIFVLWLGTAAWIYGTTLGPEVPRSIGTFAQDVLTTGPGWAMIGIGIGVGFLFAVLVLSISVVSFPLLLDRDLSLSAVMLTSLRVMWTNPVPIALWGLIVAAGLALGSLPLFLGLVFVLPILGHATWHLYRRAVEPPAT